MTLVEFLLLLPSDSGDDWFSGFQDWRIESRKRQWSFDQIDEDNGGWVGELYIGDEETNVTPLVGEPLPVPEPPEGVLSGERRQDFVGEVEIGKGVWAEDDESRRLSAHFRVLVLDTWFSFSSLEFIDDNEEESWLDWN